MLEREHPEIEIEANRTVALFPIGLALGSGLLLVALLALLGTFAVAGLISCAGAVILGARAHTLGVMVMMLVGSRSFESRGDVVLR
jgi:hypothetical protein